MRSFVRRWRSYARILRHGGDYTRSRALWAGLRLAVKGDHRATK